MNSEPSLLLHSYRRCPFAIRVRMVLEEKNLNYKILEEDLSNLSPELLALHPEGRVPLLVHKNQKQTEVIYQSTIITEYLDEAFPEVPLLPSDPSLRAQVRLWTYWCDTLFKPDLDIYKYEFSGLSSEGANELTKRLHQSLAKWNNTLSKDPYLLGKEFTLADIHLFPFARQFLAIKPTFPGVDRYTEIKRWLDQIMARPSFEKVMAKPEIRK